MDEKQEKLILDDVRLCLRQIALELEAAAEGARKAADAMPSQEGAWPPVQQLHTRLDEANYLVTKFKAKINEAVAGGARPPR